MTVQAPFAGQLTSATFTTGSVLATTILISTFSGTTPASTNENCNTNGAATCQSTNGGQTFVLQDAESLSGLAPQTSFQVSLANPVTVTANQWVAVTFISSSCSSSNGVSCQINIFCGTGCGSSGAQSGLVQSTCIKFGSSSPTTGASFTTATPANCVIDNVVGATFQSSGTTGQSVSVTQCYGNCGSPAITLANTNSTHTVNFNQSITLFYEFQSNLNGFFINVTTNVAKAYSNGIGVIEAIYVVPSCPVGQTPFSTTCPGFLASGWNVVGNPGKGRLTNGNFLIPVSNGEWLGITITATMSGLDLNDTNTNVAIFQTSGGGCACPPPPTITASSQFSAASKIGLWGFIRGNVIQNIPPPTTAGGCQSFAGIDCLFPAIVNSFCTTFTQSCQTSSALFWVVILSIFAMFVLQFGAARLIPGSKFIAGGEIFIFLFVTFILMFSGLGLLPIWIPVLIIFIVALMMGKHTGRYL